MRYALLISWIWLGLLISVAAAGEPVQEAKRKDAIHRGLAIVTRGAKNYPQHRQCFSCHHQTLPMFALAAARDAGYATDKEVFANQLAFTQTFFTGRQEALARGERIGGAAATVAYGLWTYEIAQRAPDDVTDALVANLLKLQEADGHWQPPSVRPPLEESHVSLTVLAAYALQSFARGEQQPAADTSLDKANRWLADVKLASTEDYAFSLLWHTRYAPDEQRAKAIATSLWERQREDGGWGQTPEMESDAYATGQALSVLSEHITAGSSGNFHRGIDLLLTTQAADGSWHVKSRSKPVQKYFDNGDPHGKDQFISMAATSWATTAIISAKLTHRSRSP